MAASIGLLLWGLLSGRWQNGSATVTLSGLSSPAPKAGPVLSSQINTDGTPLRSTVPPEVEKNPAAKEYFLAAMTPISFWGKVVDEKGRPVEGASIVISVHDKVFQNGSSHTKITDADGLFSMTGVRGLGIGIAVSKRGYYQTDRSRGMCGYASHAATDVPIPTSEAPAVFVLRKQGQPAALVMRKSNVRIQADGTPVSVQLMTGKPGSLGQGDLQVDLMSEDQSTNAKGRYDWRCDISVPNGGLLARDDPYAFEAPEAGYQPSDEISMSQDALQWSPEVSRNYFVKLTDGTYARLEFTVIAGGDHFFRITSYLNPTPGDRNLEFDPAKEIKTP